MKILLIGQEGEQRMKVVDDNGKFLGLINLFDLLVVVLVVALIGGVGYKYIFANQNIALNESDIELTLWVEDVRDVTVDAINEGDMIREYDSNLFLGELLSKEVTPHFVEVETADGRVVNSPVKGKYDVYLTLKSRGIVTDNAITVASKEMKIGGTIVTNHQLYAVSTKVVKIDVKE